MFCDLPSPSLLDPDLNAPRGQFLANTEPGDFFDRFSRRASLEFPQGIRRIWELLRHLAFFLQCAITSSSVKDWPWPTTMRAFTASPQISCGMPTTAHSYTCGMAMMAASTSPENTLKPPEMIMSFLRSTIYK